MTGRRFSFADQIEFAKFSHDFNPIHVDPVTSRRLIYGQPVVHGVNAMLWALANFAISRPSPIVVQGLTCSFTKPLFLDLDVSLDMDTSAASRTVLRLRQAGQIAAKISLDHTPIDAGSLRSFPAVRYDESPFREMPDLVTGDMLEELAGKFSIAFDIEKAAELYGTHLLTVFGSQAIAEMTALTKVVGMHAPGLNSLFTEIKLKPASELRVPTQLEYRVEEYDRRFHQLAVACSGKTFDARLKAFYRPPAVSQATYSTLKHTVSKSEFSGQKALIIGGSRGLGEVTAKYLSAGGADVFLTYSRGANDADAIVHDISSHNGAVQSAQLDVTSPSAEGLHRLDGFKPTDVYYFATPFIFSGQKNTFDESRLNRFLEFYVMGFQRIVDHFSNRGTNRYFCPSSVALDENPAAMGEYCVAKAAMEAYCTWLVHNKPSIKIFTPRLPRLATDQTSSIAVVDNGDTALMLELLRSFSNIECDQ